MCSLVDNNKFAKNELQDVKKLIFVLFLELKPLVTFTS